jgi:hypothetical protein
MITAEQLNIAQSAINFRLVGSHDGLQNFRVTTEIRGRKAAMYFIATLELDAETIIQAVNARFEDLRNEKLDRHVR